MPILAPCARNGLQQTLHFLAEGLDAALAIEFESCLEVSLASVTPKIVVEGYTYSYSRQYESSGELRVEEELVYFTIRTIHYEIDEPFHGVYERQ